MYIKTFQTNLFSSKSNLCNTNLSKIDTKALMLYVNFKVHVIITKLSNSNWKIKARSKNEVKSL